MQYAHHSIDSREFALELVTGPTNEPLTLSEAKEHLRLDTDDDDALIVSLIRSARQMIEAATKRALVAQTWNLHIDGGWPYRHGLPYIAIPISPVTAVSAITYVDGSSPNPTLSTNLYTVAARRTAAYVVPAYNATWPDVRFVPQAVTVRFTAGHTDDNRPEPLVQAMRLLIGHLYEHRGDEGGQLPSAVKSLVSPYLAGRVRS